jgi:L-threonylcarbamoyladenylate synthase
VAVSTEVVAADDAGIARAARLIEAGELVAFPTETVYGLGARADDGDAVARIFAAKRRPADKPLIVHVLGIDEARAVTRAWPDEAQRLAEAFWPGPLTLVLPKAQAVPDAVTAGGDTVAVRAPAHPTAIRLLAACSTNIAAPSANASGRPPPTTAADVVSSLGGRIPLVLDGGSCPVKVPSTLIDLTDPKRPRILRQGTVTRAELAAFLTLDGC